MLARVAGLAPVADGLSYIQGAGLQPVADERKLELIIVNHEVFRLSAAGQRHII